MKVPPIEINDIEDAYTFYVLIQGIPDETFWTADISFLKGVSADKDAWDAWTGSARREAQEAAQRRAAMRR